MHSPSEDPLIDRGGDTVETIARLTGRLDAEEDAELGKIVFHGMIDLPDNRMYRHLHDQSERAAFT